MSDPDPDPQRQQDLKNPTPRPSSSEEEASWAKEIGEIEQRVKSVLGRWRWPRVSSDDLIAECVLRIWQRRRRVESGGVLWWPRINDAYVMRVARNVCARWQAESRRAVGLDAAERLSCAGDPAEAAASSELVARVREGLEPGEFALLEASAFGVRRVDLARESRIPAVTLRSRLLRARASAARILGGPSPGDVAC